MTELERALVALGNEVDLPPTPDLWPGVRERLQRRRWLRPAVFAVALGAVAVGIAFAVPPARSAILRFFHRAPPPVGGPAPRPGAPPRLWVPGLGPPLSRATLQLPHGLKASPYYERHGVAAALVRYEG